jgi:hypothetical protein
VAFVPGLAFAASIAIRPWTPAQLRPLGWSIVAASTATAVLLAAALLGT